MIDLFLAFQEEAVYRRGGWANQTLVHPVGLAALVASALVVLGAPRKYAIIPFFFLMCVVARQRISIVTMDWDFIRILIMVGWCRVLLRKELRGFRMHRLDKLTIAWSVFSSIGCTIQQASGDAMLLRAGATIDTLGAYFLFRVLLRSWDDIKTLLRGAALIAIPIAAAFLFEKTTGRNLFSVFGGVREFTKIRQDRLRCQGAFAHPILAGSFWAAMIPFFVALWFGTKDRILSVAGVASALLIIFACSSSTPVAAVGLVIIGWMMYLVRAHMSTVRWSIVGALIGLELLMQKPVYHLISRIDLVGGSTGWHRYHLFDQFVKRTSEWFFVGTPSTAHWGYGLFDVTNQYVLEAVRGGILPLVFFVAMVVAAFLAVREVLNGTKDNRAHQMLGWAIGVAIFTHSMIFFAVSYFGQIVVLWHLTLAIAASAAMLSRAPETSVVRRAIVPARRPSTARPLGVAGRTPTRIRPSKERPA